MNLEELNFTIHKASKQELLENFESWAGFIQTELNASPSKENYFINHVGRELFRKLDRFGFNNLIKDKHDNGFRPEKFNLDNITHRNSLSDIKFWFDSEHVEMGQGNKVLKLLDKSGNGFDLVSDSNKSTVINSHNGIDVVSVPGDDGFFQEDFVDITNDPGNYLFYVVAKVISVDSPLDSIFSLSGRSQSLSAGSNFQIDSSSSTDFLFRISANNFESSGSIAKKYNSQSESQNLEGKFHLFGVILSIDSGLASLTLDGLEAKDRAVPYKFNLQDSLKLKILANRSGNNFPEGEFGEFIMTSDMSMRDEVESYLANKWGISLDSNHPFRPSNFQTINNVSWNPSRIPTLTWFDSSNDDSFQLDSNDVIQWDDLSGNGNHAFQDLKAAGGMQLDSAYVIFKGKNANKKTTITLISSRNNDSNIVGTKTDNAGTNDIVFTFGNLATVQDLINNTDLNDVLEILGQGDLGSTLTTNIELNAVEVGDAGNVTINANGIKSLNTLVNEHNASAQTAQKLTILSDSSFVPDAQAFVLAGGRDPVKARGADGAAGGLRGNSNIIILAKTAGDDGNNITFSVSNAAGATTATLSGTDITVTFDSSSSTPVNLSDILNVVKAESNITDLIDISIAQGRESSNATTFSTESLIGGDDGATAEIKAISKFSLDIFSRPEKKSDGVKFTGSAVQKDILEVLNDPYKDIQNPNIFAVYKRDGNKTWGNTLASFDGETNGGDNGWQLRQKANNINNIAFTTRGGTHSSPGDDDGGAGSDQNTGIFHIVSAFVANDSKTIKYNGKTLYHHGFTGGISYSSSSQNSPNGINQSAIGGRFPDTEGTGTQGKLDGLGVQQSLFKGVLKEIIVLNDNTGSNVVKIEGYLAHKWGLESELPPLHLYKNNPPTF